MTSATTPSTMPDLDEGERERLDAAIEDLKQGTRTWSALTLAQRTTLLRAVRTSVANEQVRSVVR